jgi:hypothetical protein
MAMFDPHISSKGHTLTLQTGEGETHKKTHVKVLGETHVKVLDAFRIPRTGFIHLFDC